MGKRGRKSVIEERGLGEEVVKLHLAGKSLQKIADQLGLTKSQVQDYIDRVKELTPGKSGKELQIPYDKGLIEGQIRLEITQENALSELAKQLKDYTDEYTKALDPKERYAWSQNRIRILQEMNKVTGLYDPKPCAPPPDSQDVLSAMSDEEVERRAREILAKRDRH